jgi:hypothetical protein
MIRKIASVAALAITAISTISLHANTALANNTLKVSTFNQAGYAATFTVDYTVYGTRKTISSGELTVGQKVNFYLPANSQSIRVQAVGRSLFPAEKGLIFSEERARNKSCFKIFGSSSNPQWSRSCPASESFFLSGITRVITKVAR